MAPVNEAHKHDPSYDRAQEVKVLLTAVLDQLIPFIRRADQEIENHKRGPSTTIESSLVDHRSPADLSSIFPLRLSQHGSGVPGLLSSLQSILQYSVNTFSPGFLDKLYAATNAPGIAAELILAVLNTNVHVYQVSPVLTLVERYTTKALACLFGLTGPRAGGISVQGGSASNATSIVVARNTLYPETKVHGNHYHGLELVLFTSAHGHYSIEKATQSCGFGSAAVISVPVNPLTGAMIPAELEILIQSARERGKTPFYVNATAGTTVLGSFDPFVEIAAIAKKHRMWFHIDGSWGGSFIFSDALKTTLAGSRLADSIAINPHKMVGVPMTCSFLLANDLRQFHKANTLPAGYLFHSEDEVDTPIQNGTTPHEEDEEEDWKEPDDLADLTLQCGRRGDSLKLFLSWQYYGTAGYARQMEHAHSVACHLAALVSKDKNLVLVSPNPPPCLQVCFYYAPIDGDLVFGQTVGQLCPLSDLKSSRFAQLNGKIVEKIAKALIPQGFMIDFAPATGRHAESAGKMLRVVVNRETSRETVERLVQQIDTVGEQVVQELTTAYQTQGWKVISD